LGKLLIKDLSNNVFLLEEKGESKDTVTNYNDALEKIKNEKIKLVGNDEDQEFYMHLYGALILGYERKQTAEQQAQAGITLLNSFLDKVKKRIDIEKVMVNYPLILTSKQYRDIILLVEQRKLNKKESYENLVFIGMLYHEEKGTEIGKQIKKAMCQENLNKYKDDLISFTKKYPNLYNLLRDDILSYKELEFLKGIEPKDYSRKIIRNKILKEIDMYDYKIRLENHSTEEIKDFLYIRKNLDYARAEFRGISILEDEFLKKEDIDERGYYIDPTNKILTSLEGIEEIFNNKEMRDIIVDTRHNIIFPAIRSLYAWHALIDLLKKHYGIEELEAFKKSGFNFVEDIQELNKDIQEMFFSFRGTGLQIDQKRVMFKSLFKEIDLTDLQVNDEDKEQVSRNILSHYPVTQGNLQEILDLLTGE